MNKNISPKIRFKGHIDAWEQRKLSDTFVFLQNNTLSRADLDAKTGVAKNVHYGDVLIKFGEHLDVSSSALPYIPSQQIVDKYKGSLLQDGDVVMADTAEDEAVGKCTEMAELQGFPTISGLHTIPLRPKEKFAPGYLGYYMNSGSYHDQLLPLMQGIKVTSISKGAILNTDISYPADSDEQAEIGGFFIRLDNLITLHQRKHIKLQNAKKSMLWKMFPHNDNEIPEVRLKGFTGAWSLRKLNTFVNYSSSNLAAKDSMNKGRYDLYDANNIIGKTDHTPMAEEYITIIKDGAGVGRIRMLPKNSMFIGTMGALTARNSNLNFVFTLLTANNLGNSFSGSTIPHIYFKDYGENAYYIPNYDEQCAIGTFFKNLDDLIELENRYINKLLLMKQAFLNKMFVKVEA